MRRVPTGTLAVCLVILAVVRHASAAATQADKSPGLVLTFQRLEASKPPVLDSRLARLPSLYVSQGEAPTPFTAAGPFRATFEGDLNQKLREFVTFSAEGRGKLVLRINDKQVLETFGEDLARTSSAPVRLNKGPNHFVAVYESPTKGDAALRLLWASRAWRAEPVPPMVFTHGSDPAVSRSLEIRNGRFLLAEFRCLRCHQSPDLAASTKDAMPELAIDVPSLADAGGRFNADWLTAWIANPRGLRSDSDMPRLFAGEGSLQKAADIAAFLASLRNARSRGASGDATRGGRTFADLDCLACHTLPDAQDDPARVSLKQVKAKYKSAALRDYLLHPSQHYAWNPMPDFRLSQQEADDLAAFLLSLPGQAPESGGNGNASRGRQLIATAGCLNCHELAGEKTAATFPALSALQGKQLNRGCLAREDAARGRAPGFGLAGEQRAALVAFLQTDRLSLRSRSAPEFAQRQIANMRCTNCHARDGVESLLVRQLDAESQALHQKYPDPPPRPGELFAADQRPPILTWAGEKLRSEWMAQFIAGKVPYKPRYYLRARMPAFAAPADLLARGLAEEHGYSPVAPPIPRPDEQQAQVGRTLCGKVPNRGFSCVQCHAVADVPPFAAFEAPSINFEYAAERLRHEYYMRWMRDPLRVDPNTRMPRFDDAEGKTALAEYGGDATRQFEAIWQYLLAARNIKPPP